MGIQVEYERWTVFVKDTEAFEFNPRGPSRSSGAIVDSSISSPLGAKFRRKEKKNKKRR